MLTKKEIRERNRQIMATSISRIYRQFNDGGMFAAITAYTSADNETNIKNLVSLGHDIRAMGYGFVPIEGYWEDEDTKIIYDEPSLWIPNISLEEAEELSRKYSQISFIWGSGGQFGLYYTGDKEPRSVGKVFSVSYNEKVDKAWSKYKRWTFRLTNEEAELERAEKLMEMKSEDEKPYSLYMGDL